MWNLFKIYKLSKVVFEVPQEERYQQLDANGEPRLDAIQAIYREMTYPQNFQVWRHMMKVSERRPILWGTKWNDAKYFNEVVLSKITDKEYLMSLPANTVGAHLGNLFKSWDLNDLYTQRFTEDEARNGGSSFLGATDEMRVNLTRHMFTSHDLWHVLFRYDTKPLGEGCIQALSGQLGNAFSMTYVGWVVALRTAWRHKSLEPFRIMKEAQELGRRALNATTGGLIAHSPIEFLEYDIQEVREMFDIGVPVRYKKWVEAHPNESRLDTFHPEYQDVPWLKAQEI